MIAKAHTFFLMLLVWTQTANYQLGATYDNFPMEKLGIRFVLFIFVISILFFNVIVIDSLKHSKRSLKNNFHPIRLVYPIVITAAVVCLNTSKKELPIEMLLFIFFVAIDWFDGFKDVKNMMVEKLNDYRRNRGLPLADQNASVGIFLLFPIDCVLIYLALQK